MSAPVAVTAMADATILLFESSKSDLLLAVVPVGMWAKASISAFFERARETREAQPVGGADCPQSRILSRRAAGRRLFAGMAGLRDRSGTDATVVGPPVSRRDRCLSGGTIAADGGEIADQVAQRGRAVRDLSRRPS